MQLNATFNNISVISWQSVLMVQETGVPRENSCSIQTHYPDSVPTSVCSYTLLLYAQRRSSKYQYYSLWFDLTGARAHNINNLLSSLFFKLVYIHCTYPLSHIQREYPKHAKNKNNNFKMQIILLEFQNSHVIDNRLTFQTQSNSNNFFLYKSALRKSSIQRYSIKQ